MLHSLKRSSADKATLRLAIQKLVHAHPTDVWTLAMLLSLLEQAQDTKAKYRQLVLLHSEWTVLCINFCNGILEVPCVAVNFWGVHFLLIGDLDHLVGLRVISRLKFSTKNWKPGSPLPFAKRFDSYATRLSPLAWGYWFNTMMVPPGTWCCCITIV